MTEYIHDGTPSWLSAYPNDGTLDYFGFRFYRQPFRALLIRGAAANSFTSAKALIYYAAVAHSFRRMVDLADDDELSADQLERWMVYFQSANYLYVVNRYASRDEVPDAGFTGAPTEFDEHFKPFYLSDSGEYNLNECFRRFYPEQRQWGYLAQFWRPPMNYFRTLLDVTNCNTGEYSKACYDVLSEYESWETFHEILLRGRITRAELDMIQPILNNYELSETEQQLAKSIIFDERSINTVENLEYLKGYKLITNIKDKGVSGYNPVTKEDYAMIFSYAHLNNIPLGENDESWKILLSSLTFEIGITRLYTWLAKTSHDEVIDELDLEQGLSQWVEKWQSENDLDGSLGEVLKKWKEKYLNSITGYETLFSKMLDYNTLDTAIDGVIQGILISKASYSDEYFRSDDYFALSDTYHKFTPQAYFQDKSFDLQQSFTDFFVQFTKQLIDDQHTFSYERMSLGQKAKFILRKYEAQKQYVFQIDNRQFEENRGIVNMIGATIDLWESAGVF